MLEFCRAIIVAPTAFDGGALGEVAEQAGFGDVAGIFGDAESNGLRYPVTYFLVHHRLADADCEDIVYAVRRIERRGLRYSPMIVMIADDPSAATGKYVRMGFDDVIALPASQIQLAERLETQLDSDITYFETADYLGPDRRRLDPDSAFHRPSGVAIHTQLVIRRDPDTGNRVVSRQARAQRHFHTAPAATSRGFGRRLQPPVPFG